MTYPAHTLLRPSAAFERSRPGARGVLFRCLICLMLICGLTVPAAAAATPGGHATESGRHSAASAVTGPVSTQPEPSPSVQLHIDEVAPGVLGPGQDWTLTGSASNTGSSTVQISEVRVSTAYLALDSTADIQTWVADGSIATTPRLVGADDVSVELSPEEEVSFEVVVRGNTLRPPFTFTSLPVRVEAMDAQGAPVAERRTVVPWFSEASVADPMEVSWVVPLTVPPDPALSAREPERSAAWLDHLGQGSPSQVWIDGLAEYEATFVIDPALLVPLPTAADMSSVAPDRGPSTPTQPDGSPTDPDETSPDSESPGSATDSADPSTTSSPEDVEGAPDVSTQTPLAPPVVEEATPVQEAELALQRRIGALDPSQLRWLPVADPDIAALIDVNADMALTDDLIGASLAPSILEARRLLERGRHAVAWPLWNRLDSSSIDGLQQRWGSEPLDTVVVPRSTFSDATGMNRDAVGSVRRDGEMTLWGYHEQISDLFSPEAPADADGATVQLVVALLLARYQQSPAEPGSVIIAPPRDSAISAADLQALTEALDEAPWMEQVSVAELPVAQEVSLGREALSPQPPASPLTTSLIARVEQVRLSLDEVATILEGQEPALAWSPVLDSMYSSRWRGQGEASSVPLSQLESQVVDIVDGVRIQETSVNFLANEGLIQLTLVNDLPVGLRDLQLELEPGNARLHIAEEPAPISIGPSSRATVQFRAEAVAAGQVPVTATLSTPTGLRIGDAQVLDIQVRPTGIWIYWVLGGIAGVILILGLVRAIRRPPTPRSGTVAGSE